MMVVKAANFSMPSHHLWFPPCPLTPQDPAAQPAARTACLLLLDLCAVCRCVVYVRKLRRTLAAGLLDIPGFTAAQHSTARQPVVGQPTIAEREG